MTGYAFGDSERAAYRLGLVAEVFDGTSRAFLRKFAGRTFGLAYDLGCGPGHTTRLLAEALRPRLAVGLDTSETFLELARGRASDGISFLQHDATNLPFPVGPADLVYCRFLLSHLEQPQRLPPAWSTQLGRTGLLLVEEVERITTSQPVFRRYLHLVRTMLGERDHALEVGPLLDSIPDTAGFRRLDSRVVTLEPRADQVTQMFLMNLEALRATSADPELDALAAELAEIREGEIRWELRQLSFSSG